MSNGAIISNGSAVWHTVVMAHTHVRRVDWARVRAIALGIVAGTIATAGTAAVAAAGFALSFDAIRSVAIAAYVREEMAWMMPVAIDGAMSVATITAIVLRRLGKHALYPWVVVLVGASISIACNATHAYMEGGAVQLPVRVAMAVSAIPAVNLALSIHLLVVLIDSVTRRARVMQSAPEVVASELTSVEPAPETPEVPAGGVGRSVAAPPLPPAIHARALRKGDPDMTRAQIAAVVGKSERQVQRYLDGADADEPTRVNGVAVELVGADQQ